MGKRSRFLAAVVLLVGACTGADQARSTSTRPGPSSTDGETSGPTSVVTDTSVPGTAGSTAPPVDVPAPGRLVLLDERGDIVVMDPDGSNSLAITDDGGESAVYTQPIWSPDSTRLAWGQFDGSGFAIGFQEVDAEEPTVLTTDNLPFYVYWSPTGERLGLLRNGAAGIDFELVNVIEGTSRVVDSGQPYYFSWSPSGDRLVVHVDDDRFGTITGNGTITPLGTTDAAYLAPQWTGSGILHVVDGDLILESENGDRRALVGVTGLALFVANPQGTYLALQDLGDPTGGVTAAVAQAETAPGNVLVVVDMATGELETIADEPVIGFFWSPDGDSLLILGTVETRDAIEMRIWSGGETTTYSTFVPPGSVIQSMIPFFPQYAQSVSFWSPDSSAVAFAGEISDETGVWVQPLDAEAPVRVSDGDWVAWSYD